jgi:hypothetical protein
MTPKLLRAWLVAATLSGVPSTAWALARRQPVLEATRAAGTLLGAPTVPRAVVAHGAVSAWWTWVLVRVLRVRSPGGGAVAGVVIAALDLGVVARRWAPAVAALPVGPQVADHMAFGALVGWAVGRADSPEAH